MLYGKVILYGSCARGDFNADSDLDIALITKCDRVKAKNYVDILAEISTELAMKYFIVVNFVAVPEKEFQEKKVGISILKILNQRGLCYMNHDYRYTLADVRLNRAKELLKDAMNLFGDKSYKSANNRAFYAMEKAIRALLVLEDVEPQTHLHIW